MSTLTVRLSGKEQGTMTVEGFEVNGFFVHRTVLTNPKYSPWTVSHSRSGQNLGARFTKRSDALGFARDMAANYNGHCEPQELIEQFRARGEKPSWSDLAEKHHMRRF